MRSPCTILTLLAAVAIALAATGTATAETIFAYYPFDADASDASGNGNDLTLGGTTPATIDAVSMFGAGAANNTTVTGYAQLADGDPDFDTAYTTLSVSLWAKTSTWSGTGYGNRYLTGKYATGDNRGWNLSVLGGAEVGQISFGGYQGTMRTEPAVFVKTQLTSILDGDVFHNIVATFDAGGATTDEQFHVYVDGIRQTTVADGTSPTLTQLNGANANNFQVLNRGATATSATSGGGFIGSVDDYAIATGDVLTDKQVALIHGLGRLAGVGYGSGASLGGELADVLGAFQTQGSAMAGGYLWTYRANVGGGTTVGTIGGSVTGGNAFIVLGTDGSGVTVIPEPGTLALLCAGLTGMLLGSLRRRK